MKPLHTAAGTKTLEERAAAHGLSVSILMENAGAAIATSAMEIAEPGGQFLVLCGPGNNGGDGLVVARKLAEAGRRVRVELLGAPERLGPDPKRNLVALEELGLHPAPIPVNAEVRRGDVVVDAIFGTGLNRAPEGAAADAVERIAAWRSRGARVVAADLPSGVQSDTGQAFTPCVQADVTVALGVLKRGHVLEPGASRCGEVRRVDIGLVDADAAFAPTTMIEDEDVLRLLAPRRADSHKGTYGHVLVIAGSAGKSGAAALSAQGALRTGAGLVSVATRADVVPLVLAHAPEVMGIPLPGEGPLGLADLNALLEAADGKRAVVIGPGIPRGPETPRLLDALLEELTVPCVLDADALNALADNVDLLARAKAPILLTPHPGEMARLLKSDTHTVQSDRIAAARDFAVRHHVVVVLKGAKTVVATEDGRVCINPTGNPGMATGGTGDVLSGMLGALLALGLSPADAATVGVYAHGLAGDLVARRTGMMGLVASDLFDGLCEVWTRWQR
ncbi:MAG: NAD(P)H-hydrate dehydratase [Myxococcaceae bacterium]|nr:NAD(P)H-hydrate dehydratase [Myxococcaceae bacterium]